MVNAPLARCGPNAWKTLSGRASRGTSARANHEMNTKDFPRPGVAPGETSRRAADFISKFILDGNVKARFHQERDGQIPNT
jgi:hypothetical protein